MRVAALMLVVATAVMTYPSLAQYPPRGPIPSKRNARRGDSCASRDTFRHR
jgi:hypothetical protein